MGYIKLSKKSFFHNLDYFSSLCGGKNKLSIALKDNAYGHGTYEIALFCQEYGIKHVFVRNLREYQIIKNFNFDSILVLYDIPKKVNENIIIAVNSIEYLKNIPNNSKVEIKLDTGMNRNGIYENEILKAVELIREKQLVLNGVFTHFCCADEDNDITLNQEKKFQILVKYFKKDFSNFRIHCAASAGVHKVDMSKYDLARIGIGAYGYLDLDQERYLKPVMSLYGQKIATKRLNKGDHIGYGSDAFVALKDIVVSNYNIGYGDGFFRFSEHKKANIADGRKILGRVSMDSLSVEGDDDEICIFNNVSQIAQANNTIKYEVLASLNPNIEKIK